MARPVLSIGMIFKNNIRSLERSLKALTPLREAIDCELILADTGSDDGSREVAEKYADILFDFPWINDFSAARNAVMDKASGTWFLSVDSDEYLDENISGLVSFLQGEGAQKQNVGTITVCNYDSYEMNGDHVDFFAIRLLRMSTGLRFEGAIHERWPLEGQKVELAILRSVILHHDGYVGNKYGNEKLSRNIALLREKLKDEVDLVTLMQFLESGAGESDFLEKLHQAVAGVKERWPGWQTIGPSIIRHAVIAAKERNLAELTEWIELANEWFPESFFTRVDVNYVDVMRLYGIGDYGACYQQGERVLAAYQDYREGRGDISGLLFSTVNLAAEKAEQNIRIIIARAAIDAGQTERSLELLEGLTFSSLAATQIENVVKTARELESKSRLDTEFLACRVWAGISAEAPDRKQAEARKQAFLQAGGVAFTREVRTSEREQADFQRHSYLFFLPLDNELGFAARVMTAPDAASAARALEKVQDWMRFPAPALSHALDSGVSFPLADRRLKVEEMDSLAIRLAQDKEGMQGLIQRLTPESGLQSLTWARSLVLAAVRANEWQDEQSGMELARKFAEIEKEFLARCYLPELLRPENLPVLPPMHRFGWHCAQAFAALDSGDAKGYARHLREGLSTCESMTDMVGFLTEHTPVLNAPALSQELQDLADKVRAVLSSMDPEDPAVTALRQSPVYQKVAHLIEGVEAPVVGGLVQ